MRRVLVPLALVGLILVWAGPTSAFSISFIETGDETAPIVVSTDIPDATTATAPETALVTKTFFFGVVPELQTDGVFVFGLTESGSRSTISDIVRITLTTTIILGGFFPSVDQSLVASFESDPETSLVDPGSFTDLIEETGSPQVVFDCLLAFHGECLTVTAQSDFTPVPEPSMGILVGTMGLLGLGGALWRRSRRS